MENIEVEPYEKPQKYHILFSNYRRFFGFDLLDFEFRKRIGSS
jgi:hypothetical protein